MKWFSYFLFSLNILYAYSFQDLCKQNGHYTDVKIIIPHKNKIQQYPDNKQYFEALRTFWNFDIKIDETLLKQAEYLALYKDLKAQKESGKELSKDVKETLKELKGDVKDDLEYWEDAFNDEKENLKIYFDASLVEKLNTPLDNTNTWKNEWFMAKHNLLDGWIKKKEASFEEDMDHFLVKAKEIAKKFPTSQCIFVLHEGFFNYMENPSQVGNFIPFSSEVKKKLEEKIKNFLTENTNVIFVMNIIYNEDDISQSDINKRMHYYINNEFNNNQETIKNKFKLENLNFIVNRSFIFAPHKKPVFYDKFHILDEDFLFSYYKESTYLPGLQAKQRILDDTTLRICQDYTYNRSLDTPILIVQSATIDAADSLPNKLIIHADIKPDHSIVSLGTKKIPHEINDDMKIYTLPKNEMEQFALKHKIKTLEDAGADCPHSEVLCHLYEKKNAMEEK